MSYLRKDTASLDLPGVNSPQGLFVIGPYTKSHITQDYILTLLDISQSLK